MQYVRLGRSGLKVSRIGLGMMSYGDPSGQPWALVEDEAEPIVRRAVEAGITFFDTADMYSDGASEQITGRLLRNLFPRRDDYVLATKVYYPTGQGPNDRGLSRKHILASIDASLRRLGTDHVDLYQIHRWDPATPIEETLEALHDVVKAGKARHIGASSMHAWQFSKSLYISERCGWTRFATMQNHYNLLYREEEREMLPLCVDQGIGVIPWSPLARGRLTRPWDASSARAQTDEFGKTLYADGDRPIVEQVATLAERRGVPPAQVALAWMLRNPVITAPIIGATKPHHIDDAIAALSIDLTAEETMALEQPYTPRAIAGFA